MFTDKLKPTTQDVFGVVERDTRGMRECPGMDDGTEPNKNT